MERLRLTKDFDCTKKPRFDGAVGVDEALASVESFDPVSEVDLSTDDRAGR